jgi:hypothetical protein
MLAPALQLTAATATKLPRLLQGQRVLETAQTPRSQQPTPAALRALQQMLEASATQHPRC